MELLTPTFDVAFILIIIGIVAFIAFVIFKIFRNWAYNKSQPRIAAEAIVVTKRTDYSRHHHTSDNFHRHSSWYYVTFEFTTGDRKEFLINESDYGLLVEDDKGMLTFQGNQFISFQRNTKTN